MLTTMFGSTLAFIGLGGSAMLLILLIPVGWLVCSVAALVDTLRSNFRGSSDKLIWVLVILFLPLFGGILYFTVGRQQRVV